MRGRRTYKERSFYDWGSSNMGFHRMGHRRVDIIRPGKRRNSSILYDAHHFSRHAAIGPLIHKGGKPPRGSTARVRARITASNARCWYT